MINKKILAAAIATAFTMNAHAVIDMDLATQAGVKVASEATGTVAAGMYTLTNTANALDFDVTLGFAMAANNEKYIRVDLVNAAYTKTSSPSVANVDNAFVSAALQSGGAAGDTYAVFKVVGNGTTGATAADEINIVAVNYSVSSTAASSVNYGLYETALDAINKAPNATYKTADAPLVASTAAVSTGKIATTPVAGVGTVTATSASAFKKFAVEGSTTATLANLGSVDAGLIVSGTETALSASTGVTVVATEVIPTTAQVIKFSGDFSVGTWSANTNTDCTTSVVTTTLNTAKTELSTAAVNPHTPVFLCQAVDGKTVVAKNSYSAELVTTKQSGTVGSVVYDTTSINVPYLTTFSDYNQRIYLLNTSTVDANYTTTFVSEAGVTAVAGTAATGVVPAKSLLTIKASDMVTLTGKTRTTAVIEVETGSGNISATTQTVNVADSSTDTLVLKAR